jgi:hypothetical protein
VGVLFYFAVHLGLPLEYLDLVVGETKMHLDDLVVGLPHKRVVWMKASALFGAAPFGERVRVLDQGKEQGDGEWIQFCHCDFATASAGRGG